jgi:hypothetical protein
MLCFSRSLTRLRNFTGARGRDFREKIPEVDPTYSVCECAAAQASDVQSLTG